MTTYDGWRITASTNGRVVQHQRYVRMYLNHDGLSVRCPSWPLPRAVIFDTREAESGYGACFGDTSGPEEMRGNSEFWDHLSKVTGKEFDQDHIDGTHFRCGC